MDGQRDKGNRRRGSGLSRRELEVLSRVARGMTNSEVAEDLSIAEATVKRHLANSYEALGVHSRVQAVAALLNSGVLSVEGMAGHDGLGLGHDAPERWRCSEKGCGCEVAVVAAPLSGASWRPPVCHGREMVRARS